MSFDTLSIYRWMVSIYMPGTMEAKARRAVTDITFPLVGAYRHTNWYKLLGSYASSALMRKQ